MIQNKFGELVYSESDVCDLLMQGQNTIDLKNLIVNNTVDLARLPDILDPVPEFVTEQDHNVTVAEFHAQQQSNWRMPDDYKNVDIAEHILNLCVNQDELQRCGTELLMYQERDLFDLLRYLRYLVDVMQKNQIIWGVGRGSSVASYVLYKLGVHRIDSMYYDLDPAEFLR
jgi:DNA polymerase III alpha subunit